MSVAVKSVRQYSDWYTSIVSSLLFPIHERLKGHVTTRAMKSLEKTQWWSAEDLKALQLQRLQRLLVHAYKHVPYYQNLFDTVGFDSTRVNSLEALTQIPFLTKSIIRANSDALKSAIPDGLAKFNTGGSSGEPLIFYIGNERVSHDVAAKWRATRWWGVDIGDPELVLWGSPIELGAQDRIRVIRDKFLRTGLLPAFEMSEQKLEEFIAAIQQAQPKMLFGYPSAFARIADYALRNSIDMTSIGVKVVFVTSERLYADQRSIIEQCFACRVANGYGGRDAGFIAHECPAGNMHITAEDIIVETVDSRGISVPPGKAGEIVVTHLATKGYPFIRYKTGDIGVLSELQCECGRGLPLLQEIQGRSTDFVISQDGNVMHGLALIYILREIDSIKEFKIIQQTNTKTRILLVVRDNFSDADAQKIITGFQSRLGAGVMVDVEQVEAIPAEKSGKFRYVISHAI